jgi:hypothetical protein
MKVKAESSVKINDLIEKSKELDGQEVTIQGEAIGESMKRGDYSWIYINDGTNATGVWISNKEADKIVYYGDYQYIGDTIKITGVFYRACTKHGGEADFHGNSIKIIKEGYQVKELIPSLKIISAVVLIPIALLMFIIYVKMVRNKRMS